MIASSLVLRLLASVAGVVLLSRAAIAAPPPPSGAHPRLFLTGELRTRLAELSRERDSPVAQAVRWCADVRARPQEFAGEGYQGLDWAKHLQACLVAWAATDDEADARTALRYLDAMVEDLRTVGDGQGGDRAVQRDSGFPIRALGPYAAIAYDWLHAHPAMTDALRDAVRRRFAAWTAWYAASGYRARSPGTNYQSGYLLASTLIAIAGAGESEELDALWTHVHDVLWGQDLSRALVPGALLDGGDWAEGWQYGPLAVASYALAGRAMVDAGVAVPGLSEFLGGVLLRHVHALTPGGGVFAAGDAELEAATLPPAINTLAGVALGPAPPDARSAALGELARLRLIGAGTRTSEFPLLAALAAAAPQPARPPRRDGTPTWYLAAGAGNLYARTGWGDAAVWTAMQCTSTLDVDHFHANAGNVVLSRGADDALVDPSPYGTLSTRTGNAPTVASAHLPAEYIPGQAFWSQATRWVWAHQSAQGLVTARCDYADQYRFQHRPTDVPQALRDLVLVPWGAGDAATLVVVDRAVSGAATRSLFTQFRVAGELRGDGDVLAATVGRTELAVRRVGSSTGQLTIGRPAAKDCWTPPRPRGDCDAARVAVTDARLEVAGPRMHAAQLIDVGAIGAARPAMRSLDAPGVAGVFLEAGASAAAIVWGAEPPWQASLAATTFTYRAPAHADARHVVLDAPGQAERVHVTARRVEDACEVTLEVGGDVAARPLHVVLDAACAVTPDPMRLPATLATLGLGGDAAAAGSAAPVTDAVDPGVAVRPSAAPRRSRTGCCGVGASPSDALFGVLLVAFGLRRRATSARARREP